MRGGPPEGEDVEVAAVAARHGFSPGAAAALRDAIRRGGGRMAQFSHPELGGMGQWSGGAMLQIGAMFDHALKARVAAACADLAEALGRAGAVSDSAGPAPLGRQPGGDGAPPAPSPGEPSDWWGGDFGRPSASGSQNGMRYAIFAAARRLAVGRGESVTIYDTGRHSIFGASQSQSGDRRLAFTADDGTVDLDALRIVDG